MNYQMKSRRYGSSLPSPPKKISWVTIVLMITFLLFCVGFVTFAILRGDKEPVTLIEVDGKMCEIHFKQTGITSTGAATGHSIAVCPK